MTFGKIIEELKKGMAVYREGWNGKGMFVVKQIPCTIDGDTIPHMQSLPHSAKEILMGREKKEISYTNQMLIINQDGRADSWVPSSSDVFADDWQIVGMEDNYITRMKTEMSELTFKIDKLVAFLKTEEFAKLDERVGSLLKLQYDAMLEYRRILSERIAVAESNENKEE